LASTATFRVACEYFSANIGRVYTRVYKYNPLRTEIKFPENYTVTDKHKI